MMRNVFVMKFLLVAVLAHYGFSSIIIIEDEKTPEQHKIEPFNSAGASEPASPYSNVTSSAELDQLRTRRKKLLIRNYSTREVISFVTSTTVVPLTCALSQNNAGACQKRRRKSIIQDMSPDITDNLFGINELEGSSDVKETSDRKGRFAIIHWRTSTSTFTITSTSINSAITFSVSYLCTVNGVDTPTVCA